MKSLHSRNKWIEYITSYTNIRQRFGEDHSNERRGRIKVRTNTISNSDMYKNVVPICPGSLVTAYKEIAWWKLQLGFLKRELFTFVRNLQPRTAWGLIDAKDPEVWNRRYTYIQDWFEGRDDESVADAPCPMQPFHASANSYRGTCAALAWPTRVTAISATALGARRSSWPRNGPC